MATIVGVSGSLRSGSFNTRLLEAAARLMPPTVTLEIATIRGIPLYDADVEAASGIPAAAAELKERIASADRLLIATPEYNGSIPGVLKNAIDWTSRPPADMARVYGGRRVAILGASAGAGATGLSQAAWLPVLRTLGTLPWFGGRMQVAFAAQVFDETGAIQDAKVRSQLERFVHGFAAFIAG